MHKRLFVRLLIASPLILLFCTVASPQDKSNTPAGLSQQSNISEVMEWLDKNGLAQARVGITTSSKPARKEISGVVQQEAYPALGLFYAEGFKVVQGDVCNVILKNDDTRLLAHSKLVQAPPPDHHYTAELFIPLDRLSIKKAKGPYRHTSDPDKAQLLGTWRMELRSKRSQDDVVLTLFGPGQNTITVADSLKSIKLRLALKIAAQRWEYRASIQTLDGRQVTSIHWTEPLTPNRNGLETPEIPTSELPSGEYVLLLFGKEADGLFVRLAKYYFRVIRNQ